MKRYTAGEVIDKYKIVSVLGEGGIGIVYRAEHMLLGTDVALKMCKLQNSHAQERLRIEGRAQTKLKHPNIVSVHDMIDIDHSPCLVMEHVSGCGLDEWLDTNKPTKVQAQRLFLQILDAMEFAHSQNIIHRDLKPSNIMITQINGRPFAKVCDFGLAKIQHQTGPNLTKTGAMMGTPAYMAPEQIRNAKETDHRADVFSLGAIYYELLTGTMAFSGADTLELLNSVANEPHRPPNELIPDLEDRHNCAIQGSLTKNPINRIPDCSIFRAVLLGEITWTDPKERIAQHDTLLGDGEKTLELVRSTKKISTLDDEATELMPRNIPQDSTMERASPLSSEESSKTSFVEQKNRILSSFQTLLIGIFLGLGMLLFIFIPQRSKAPAENIKAPPSKTQITVLPSKKQENLSAQTQVEIETKTTATKTKNKRIRAKKGTKTKSSKKTIRKTIVETKTKSPVPQETASVSFSGADGLILKGKKGTFRAGKVPVGTYKVYGVFKNREIPVGDITLKPNQKKHFTCTKTLRCN